MEAIKIPTIKGPIKIKGGFNSADFIKDQADGLKVKLPFEATGFKSSKTPKMADMTKVKLAGKKSSPAKKAKSAKPESKPPKASSGSKKGE